MICNKTRLNSKKRRFLEHILKSEKQVIIINILKGSGYEKIRGVWKMANAWFLARTVVIYVL
jgi:hypothetical protein